MNAYAYVVGPQDGPGTALFDMANALGFVGVSSFRGIEQAEEQSLVTPVCYFLFSAVDDPASLRPVAEAVRFCSVGRVRFSPLIYCAEMPSVDTTMACVNIGFDDVVALPQPLRQLRERLARQVGQSLTYYETAGYFGPDRRRRIEGVREDGELRKGEPFRRLEVVRNLLSGIAVLRDEVWPPAPPVALMQTLQ